MKKNIRILIAVFVAVAICLTFASCQSKLSGEYVGDMGIFGSVTYAFNGENIEISYITELGEKSSVRGTYSIDGDLIMIWLDGMEVNDDAKIFSGEYTFEKTDDGIKIGAIEYKKDN